MEYKMNIDANQNVKEVDKQRERERGRNSFHV